MKNPLLIDLDGVLRIGNKPAKFISEFLNWLNENNIRACILSNSSLYSAKTIYKFFQSYSINIDLPILTTVDFAVNYVNERFTNIAVFASEEVKNLLKDKTNYKNPEAVLIGDIGQSWNYDIMQQIFNYLLNGAKLIAMHKNKYWNTPDLGIQLDAGPFVHALEYAASIKATILGKPSELYFNSALEIIGERKNSKFIMIGDDLVSDIMGARGLDAITILIYTGKTKKTFPKEYSNFVDFEADNLLDVKNILTELYSLK